MVKDGFERLWGGSGQQTSTTLADLIAAVESQTTEFKETARWNVRADQQDKKMEQVIVKTVCGFLNAEGGSLLIGVADDGQVVGLEPDMKTLGARGNRDGYELFLRQLLDTQLSISTAGVVNIRFESDGTRDVCVVSAASAGKPVFAKPAEGGQATTDFWVRIGNATKQLHGDEMMEYQSIHWG